MFVKVFVLYSIFFLVSSCQSTLDIESFNDSVSERVGNYSFGLPDVFVVNSSESASLTLAYESGETYFQTYWVEQTSTGNSKCDVSVDDAYASNPVLTISNCTGNGRVTLSYGDSQSHQIHVSNDSISYDNSWEINVSNDGKSIFAIDRTDSRVLKVDIQTGVKTLLFSETTGLGDTITDIISFQLNADESKLYGLNFSANQLFVIDLATKTATILSDDDSTGTDFNNLTRFVVDSNEQYAYVLDRDYASWRTIVKVDLSTGERTATTPDPYIKVSYGITFGQTEDIIYYTDRDNNYLYSVDLTSTDAKVVIAENTGSDAVDFNKAQYLVKDPLDTNNMYVLNWNGSDVLLKVDLTTGEKTLVAGRSGNGPYMTGAQSMDISSDGKTMYVVDITDDVIYAVDIETGDRVVISK